MLNFLLWRLKMELLLSAKYLLRIRH